MPETNDMTISESIVPSSPMTSTSICYVGEPFVTTKARSSPVKGDVELLKFSSETSLDAITTMVDNPLQKSTSVIVTILLSSLTPHFLIVISMWHRIKNYCSNSCGITFEWSSIGCMSTNSYYCPADHLEELISHFIGDYY